MIETLLVLPPAFWLVTIILIVGAFQAKSHLPDGSGLPMLAVLGTVTTWYVGDAFYNGYADYYAKIFETDVLRNAWWEVAWFLIVFLLATPWLHARINARHIRRGSGVLQIFKHGVSQPRFQSQLNRMFYGCAFIWSILAAIAIIKLQGDALYYFFPFLGLSASPWSHNRIGAGLDFLSIVALYLQMLVGAIFGVVVAVATNRRVRWLALFGCLMTWPYFIFGHARSYMLAIAIPGVVSWVFFRLRGSMLKRFAVLGLCFLLVNAWMAFIISNRTHMGIIGALKEKGFSLNREEEVHHQGLNMYEELCWINTFIEQGTYHVNWGHEYFAELVNPIPRVWWPGKPLIGVEYSIARGQGGGTAQQAGIHASIATGLVGQGIVNFGRILGPAFAALLTSLWAVLLARLDLRIYEFGRLPLYALGLLLTFNLGRDITLLVLYPFVFGGLLVWWVEYRRSRMSHRAGLQDLTKAPRNPLQSKTLLTQPGKRLSGGITSHSTDSPTAPARIRRYPEISSNRKKTIGRLPLARGWRMAFVQRKRKRTL